MPELRELSERLGSIVGLAHWASGADGDLERYAVDGCTPAAVVAPADPSQTAAVLVEAARSGAAVIPWGGGTAMGRGHAPSGYDVALSLARLDSIVDFDVDNLTVTVQAGLSLNRLQTVLGDEQLFVPLDPPLPNVATVGGIVAANSNGPGRVRFGSVRDLVLGMRVALTTGEVIHAGGKTVKNVAGYDLSKLFIGSYGTLGVVTEVTFRLLPCPAEKRALWLGFACQEDAFRLAGRVLDSVLLPTYMTILNRGAIEGVRPECGDPFALVIGLDGSPETVERQVRDVTAMAEAPELLASDALTLLERALADFGYGETDRGDAGLAGTVSLPISALEPWCAMAESYEAAGSCLALAAHVPSGTVRFLVAADDSAALVDCFANAVAAADDLGGHGVLDWAAPVVKLQVPVWGTPRAEWRLSQAIKQKFDPTGTLSRGRFVGQI